MAGTEVGSLYYDLNIDDKNLKKQLDDADKSVKGFGDRVNQYWGNSVDASKKFMLAVTAAAAATVAFGVSSVKAFEDSQNKIAQTNAVLKSTGQVAGITADAVTKLATALEAQTKFSDEDVRSVENLLLTFTSIGKDVFPQATKTVLDMATALGEDTSSASIQLGKALQDPILGVTALRRVGVNFNETQKETITKLVESGHQLEAQKLILAELNKEFGGSAVAAGDTLAGALAKLKNQFNNVQEAIGGMLARVATPLLDALLNWFYRIGGVDGVLKLLNEQLERLKPYLPYIAGAILGMLVPAVIALTVAAGEFILTMAPWALLGIGLVQLWLHWGQVTAYLTTTIRDLWAAFTNLTIIIILGQYISQVFWPALQAIAAALWQNLLPALGQLWDAFMRLWNALNPALMDALKFVGAIIFGTLLIALYALVAGINIVVQVFAILVSGLSIAIDWISNLIGWFGNLLGVVKNVVTIIANIVMGIPSAFGAAVSMTAGIVRGIPGLILAALGALGSLLWQAGRDLVQGMINGITSKFAELGGAVKNAVGSAVSSVKNFLGIHSPSTVFHEIGQNVTQGFVNGINASAHLAANAMGNIGANIISPSLATGPSTINGGTSQTTRYGDTYVNIDTVNNQQDEDYVLRRLDRNGQLIRMGGSPISG